VGKEVVRAVAPGEVVIAAAVAPPRTIRRGSVVSLILEGQGFRIVARGIASEDGAVGQTIKVVNQSSRRELAGRIEDERTVRVGP
jgi:flagella basal body P-ring formation protein FlgA